MHCVSECPHSDRRKNACAYLQNEDEVVDGFSALVKVVLRRAFVALVEFELLDDVGVSEDPQQDFLCDLEWAEQTDLWGRTRRQRGGVRNTNQDTQMDDFLNKVNFGFQKAEAFARVTHL